MRLAIKTILVFIILVSFISCQAQKPIEKEPAKPAEKEGLSPIYKLTMATVMGLGFMLVEENGKVVVKSLKKLGPAAVAGLKEGDSIETMGGLKLQGLTLEDAEKIIEAIKSGTIPVSAVDSEGKKIELNIKLDRSNCPQKRSSGFIFVSEPQLDTKPYVFIAQIEMEIFKEEFDRKVINWIQFFDAETDHWYIVESDPRDFPLEASIEGFDGVVSPEFKIDASIDKLEGSVSYKYTGNLELKFQELNSYDINGKIFTGTGTLKINDKTVKGRTFVSHEIQYFIEPFAEKINKVEPLDLPPGDRHMLDKFIDWLILLDAGGNALLMNVDGQFPFWNAVYFPAGKEATILKNFDMSWFDETVEGLEGDPYPGEIQLKFPGDLNLEYELKGYTPRYLNDEQRIYIPIGGSVTSSADANSTLVAGFLRRLRFE